MLSIDRRYALPVGLALTFLVTFFVVTEVRKDEVRQAAVRTWLATDRLRMLTDLRALLTDAETGQRGYLLTGERSYLDPFEQARSELPSALEQLRNSYSPADAIAMARLEQLAQLAKIKLDELETTIRLYRQRGPASALRVVNTDKGAHAMTELRKLIDRMRSDERDTVAAATELWNREHTINTVVMVLGTLLNMVLVVWAGHLVTREMRHRRSENERLEQEVAVRTHELTALSSHLQHVSESEKSTLARELHDELGALLVAVKMDLSQLRRHLPSGDPEIERRWSRIQAGLSEGIDLKRRVVEQLRPTLLDNMGLSAALKWQFQESCGRAGLLCREHFPEEEPEISGDAAIAIFRVVQESLTNIVKHARAKTVDLSLEIRDGKLLLAVDDDGVGLPPERQRRAGIHGLSSMRHRVRSLGGELFLEPGADGIGTRVRIAIPMARLAAATAAA